MSPSLIVVQSLNGLQLGLILFLIAAGLTLVFGVLGFVNLAHGALYMLGAYLIATFSSLTNNFFVSLLLTIFSTFSFGLLLNWLVLSRLSTRSHSDQVLGTLGLLFMMSEGARLVWGASPLSVPSPKFLAGAVDVLGGAKYPIYRMAIIGSGVGVAFLLYALINHSRLGLRIRAGATDSEMIAALGVDIRKIFTLVFAIGAMLAGFAGAMVAPIVSVEPGMGDDVLILGFVVIIIGGVGSVRGALLGALLVGFVDTLGRLFVVQILKGAFNPQVAQHLATSLAPMLIYLVMIVVLYWRPSGLFSAGR